MSARAEPGLPVVGALLLSEIREQPAVLRRLADQAECFQRVADEAVARGTRIVRMVAHGSSDNAASSGVYAFGLLPGWTALRDSISLSVYYGAEVDLRDSCVLALSQSGRTPDVVDYVERAARPRRVHDRVTNDADSPLAEAADAVLPLLAGEEHAIAATKTYTAQVATVALLAAHAAGQGPAYVDGLRVTADLLESAPARARAGARRGRDAARLRRPDARGRPRPRVRDRARDLAEAARDVPRRRRAADGHRPRARAGRRARLAVPRLGDRRRTTRACRRWSRRSPAPAPRARP